MSNLTPRIATIEIPVINLKESLEWYVNIFNLKIHFQGDKNAMLTFDAKGVPTIYLVETKMKQNLSFQNSHSDVTHSIIDFYTPSLIDFHNFLLTKGVKVNPLNIDPTHGFGGFSFEDLNGNLLGATNVLHKGQ